MILYNFQEKKTSKERDSYCKMKHTTSRIAKIKAPCMDTQFATVFNYVT